MSLKDKLDRINFTVGQRGERTPGGCELCGRPSICPEHAYEDEGGRLEFCGPWCRKVALSPLEGLDGDQELILTAAVGVFLKNGDTEGFNRVLDGLNEETEEGFLMAKTLVLEKARELGVKPV